jgi:hypothetical protein
MEILLDMDVSFRKYHAFFFLLVLFFTFPLGANAAAQRVQTTQGNSAGYVNGDWTIQWSRNTRTGNTIICSVAYQSDSGGTVSGISDSQSNTYNLIATGFTGDNNTLKLFYAYNITGGAVPTITITNATQSIRAAAICREYSGLRRSNPLDTYTGQANSSGTSHTSGTSGAVTQNNELIVGALAGTLTGTCTAGSGYGNVASQSMHEFGLACLEDKDIFGGGAQEATFTTGGAMQSYALVAGFKEGAAISRPPNNLGLVGYWPMNEATSTIAGDFSGRGNHGTFPGGSANPSWASGKRGNALSFDGSADYVPVGVSGFPTENGNQTVSAWVYYSSAPGAAQNVFGRYGTDSGSGFGFHDLAGCSGSGYRMGTWTWGGVIFLCTATLPAIGVWHLMTYTWDGTTHRFYVDGVEADTDTTAPTTNTVTLATIGAWRAGGAPDEYFPGKIDEVRIYNRAITPTEVMNLYTSGAARLIASSKTLTQGTTLGPSNGLVGHWSFDGGDVTQQAIYDGSGNNNNGYLIGNATSSAVTIGKLGQAFRFDGSDDYVRIPHSTSLDITGSAITLAAWVKLDGGGDTEQQIVGKVQNDGTHTDPYFAYQLAASSVDASTFSLRCGLTISGGYSALLDGPYPINGWSHVACTYDGTNRRLYLNGVQVDSDSLSGNISSFTSTVRLGVNGVVDEALKGSLDDVRIYNRALSATEVKQLYRLGQAVIKQ